MIRSEQSIVRYDFNKREVLPDRLMKARDAVYLNASRDCLEIYREGTGRIRQELHRDVEECLLAIPGCPPRRVAAFCKLLDDAGTFAQSTGKASALRKRIFQFVAPLHPVVQEREGIFEHDLQKVRQQLGAELKLSWEEIEDRMFSDVIELQKLKQFPESLAPETLLSRYNLAQTQAALYRATTVQIDLASQASYVLKQAKLAGLMHRVSCLATRSGDAQPRYRIVLDGPTSTLRDTTRYGIGFAKLLTSLLACSDWRLMAQVIGPQQRTFALKLSPADRLSSDVAGPEEFDSELERRIAKQWHDAPVCDWQLARDQEFVIIHQEVFTPDFVLTHADGRKIYVEIVGYWTPEYLQEKQQRLEKFSLTGHSRLRWLIMLDRIAARTKDDWLQKLKLPVVVISKENGPQQWIHAAWSDESTSHEPARVTFERTEDNDS